MTDANGVTVSNGYADNNAPYDVATATIDGKHFQKMLLFDSSGNEVIIIPDGQVPGALAIAAEIATSRPVGVASTTTRINTGGNDYTSTIRVGDYIKMLPGGTLTLANVSRKISAVTSTYIDVETAFPATPAAGVDLWDALRVTNAQVSGERLSVSIGAVESVSFVVTNGGLTALLDTIVATGVAPPASAIQIGGVDPDGFDGNQLVAPNVVNRTPGASEYGIITRNIPSGTQTVTGVVTAVPSLGAANLVDRGKVAGSSLTTSYQTLLSMGSDAVTLHVWNSTEVPVIVSFDAGSSDTLELGPYENYSEDFGANDRYLTMADIEVKLVSGSAAVNGGSVRCKITI